MTDPLRRSRNQRNAPLKFIECSFQEVRKRGL